MRGNRVNVSQLRAFVTVVDRGSFSAAARDLAISQPAVTMQLQSLESDLGATLLDRRYRRVDLTEAGRALLPHARAVLDQLEQARLDIDELSDRVTGRLSIAASTTPGVYLVPSALGAFVSAYPEVGVSVALADTARVVEDVESGRAHIGIVGATVRGARVSFEQVGHDELVLICPAGHPLATRQKVPLSELCEERWVLRESGSGTRQVAEHVLAEHGLDPAELRVAVELGTGEAIVSAVEGGLGLAIMSRSVAGKALQLGTVQSVDAIGLPAERPFYVVLPKTAPTRAALAFYEQLLESTRG
jgi:DNA-binding transcriptional LysR family regulator